MKLAGVAILLGVLVAVATGDSLTTQQKYVLTPIDSVPSSQDLAEVNLVVPDDLVLITANTGGGYDTAVRLRAIHGLAVYCTTPGNSCPDLGTVHTALTTLISANASAHAGSELLLLRAAIEADGPLKQVGDLQLFRDLHLLDHPSRDIRAATAKALAQLRNCQATSDLRVRYQNESTDQVKLAISETLRILSQPNYCLVN
jgi:hypothetical protein